MKNAKEVRYILKSEAFENYVSSMIEENIKLVSVFKGNNTIELFDVESYNKYVEYIGGKSKQLYRAILDNAELVESAEALTEILKTYTNADDDTCLIAFEKEKSVVLTVEE